MIQLHVYEEVVNFKKEVISFLEKNEQENNLILGVLQMVQQPIFMGVAKQEEEIAIVFLQTEEKKQIIVATSEMVEEAIVELAKKLAEVYPNVPGLIGNKKVVQKLAEEIAVLENKKMNVVMEQGVYALQQVKKKWTEEGIFREINSDELPVIEKWIYQFCEDVNLPTTKEEAEQTAHTLITNHRLFGLEIDGKLVSVAAKTRPTKNNITVNFVYTPKEERKKGYASNCVAALSQRMLDEGYKTTTLYTDLANPTSNKIYQEIGYEQIAESMLIFLEK
ncbi:GNAT family N-acetyltransferase [Bacillus cereus group sp. BC251]|jgi:predicted GNAT family acetyltransferase|uniref:GNAT family N-acetyltransferase n=1 Tax=Bacillus cereus group TaxID=86661 RepID=UPI000C32ED45|nr:MULTISPECIES: GNAT family N-acetyltransferase [Bacillus cereus group]AUD21706.1 GNAT family N-acetyltransferase [Bacillus sp. HBCD-sjtu]MDH8001916.1 GNAT family N-acetyltransferase [Bacillus cereus]HDR4392325.1 GNAT family N-acetyltransferase [Bacillus cereus]HDR4599863.1 GNAT family N-acetyltransferase [Bacillus cereus]HDR4657456.1 GNAT family N-acetyltransferase [Bacillus cereus]